MAYSTGVSATISDLMTALVNFAVANGWTSSTWTASGKTLVALTRSGAEYVVIEYDATTVLMNTASAVVGSGLAVAQTNAAPVNGAIRPIQAPHVGYHLFTDGLAVHCCVEVVSGVFTHINFGLLTKNGTWTGGTFVTGSCQSTNAGLPYTQLLNGYNTFPFAAGGDVGVPNVSFAATMHFRSSINGAGRTAILGATNQSGMDAGWGTAFATNMGRDLLSGPNAVNGRAIIVPVNVVQATSGTSGPYYQLGNVPNAGMVNIANLDPKAVVNTDWMLFPIGQKNGSGAVYIDSGNYAMAYKK